MNSKNKFEELNVVEIVAEKLQLRKNVAEHLAYLIEVEECTIPFIARYRKEKTNNMEAEKLRMFSCALKEIREVQKKADVMIKKIEKQGQLNDEINKSIKCAQSIEELNHLFAPYKGDQKHSLADRARKLGLEEAAVSLLNQPHAKINLRDWVKKGTEGLATLSEVEKGVKYLIADHIAKHTDTLNAIRQIFQPRGITLHSKMSVTKPKETNSKVQPTTSKNQRDIDDKYKLYFNFQCGVTQLKSFQVLAINRGEAQKQLNVKIMINERIETEFFNWCHGRWSKEIILVAHKVMVENSIDDAYKRLIRPLVVRRIRSDLTKSAHLASVEVFRHNLKKLLLTAPVRDKIVLGVDPGFKNGCKCAIVSSTGTAVLDTFVFNLNDRRRAIEQMRNFSTKHKFEIIAIGNGTACRETEQLCTEYIRQQKSADLVYCIVNENGASIYSVTEDAEKELPNLDPNLRSAVSIARRLQDPLVELVKIEPKHLGVGMYQHDVPDSLLKASLNDVVEDCVTFVGVDLNVAGASLLKRIAGLKSAQVEKIIKWREKHGRFVNRQQLLDVPGIGNKTFQQCAGFVRIAHFSGAITGNGEDEIEAEDIILPNKKRKLTTKRSTKSKKQKLSMQTPDYLDQTWIHPESYEVTKKLLASVGCKESDIGKLDFISRIKKAKESLQLYVDELSVGKPTLELIFEGLVQPTGYRDVRQESATPLYRRGVRSLCDLRTRDVLQGRVTNVTDFGIFVDVGIGQDGLAHCSKVQRWDKAKENLGPNDRVTVSVIDASKKLSLRLVSYAENLAKLS